jgi:hypothetical protein
MDQPGQEADHLPQVMRLRMNGGIPLLPVYAFVIFTVSTLRSYYLFVQDEDNAQCVIEIGKFKINGVLMVCVMKIYI